MAAALVENFKYESTVFSNPIKIRISLEKLIKAYSITYYDSYLFSFKNIISKVPLTICYFSFNYKISLAQN